MSEWTTTLPTVPGWWWTWNGYEAWPILLHEWQGRLFHQITTDIEESVEKTGTHWLGPIPVPEPPMIDDPDDDAADAERIRERVRLWKAGELETVPWE